LDLALPEISNKSYGFLLTRSLKKNAARNKRAKNAVSTWDRIYIPGKYRNRRNRQEYNSQIKIFEGMIQS